MKRIKKNFLEVIHFRQVFLVDFLDNSNLTVRLNKNCHIVLNLLNLCVLRENTTFYAALYMNLNQNQGYFYHICQEYNYN